MPKNLHLQRISLPELSLGIPLICSISREEFLNRLCQPDAEFNSKTLVFGEGRSLTVTPEDLNFPSQEFASQLMDEVFKHFCSGTYWFFGGVLTLLEKRGNGGPEVALGLDNYVQLLAVIATLHDSESNPVVLYPANLLV